MGLWEITFPARSQSQQTASITVSGGMPIVRFFGVPNFTYDVQRSTNLSPEIGLGWMTIEETNMPNTGEFQFWDHFGDLGAKPTAAWYRLHLP